MKKYTFLAVLTLVGLILCTSGAYEKAYGITKTFTAKNGGGKALISYSLSDFDTAKKKTWAVVELSLTPSFSTIIQAKTDSFVLSPMDTMVSKKDTLFTTVDTTRDYYVRVRAYQSDSAMTSIDTATGLSWVPVTLKPTEIMPRIIMATLINAPNQPVVVLDYRSWDTLTIKYRISYGDVTYSWPYLYKSKLLPGNGTQTNTDTLPWMPNNYKYSLKVEIINSKGDTITGILYDTTFAGPSAATVGSIKMLAAPTPDSITFTVPVVTNGLSTTVTSYFKTGSTVDSLTKTVPGQGGVSIVDVAVGGRMAATTYTVWVTAKNSMNITPAKTVNAVITTKSLVTKFTATLDSATAIDSTSMNVHITVTVPSGDEGNVYALVNLNPDSTFMGPTYFMTETISEHITPGLHTFTLKVSGLSYGQKIFVALFGANKDASVIHSVGDIVRSFTLTIPKPATGIRNITTIGFQIYPNPIISSATINTDDPHGVTCTIVDMTGRTVRSFDLATTRTFLRGDLPSGSYIAVLSKEGTTVGYTKILLQ